MQAIAELLGVCQRTLRRWRIHISGKGFSVDQRKGAQRNVAHKLSIQERQNIINVINEMRFAHLPPAQVVAILAEEGNYIGSEMTIYRIMREEGLLNHRGRARQMRKKREVPMLEARGIKQVLAWDITLLPSPIIGRGLSPNPNQTLCKLRNPVLPCTPVQFKHDGAWRSLVARVLWEH